MTKYSLIHTLVCSKKLIVRSLIIIILLDSIDTTCPYCSSVWKNKKGRDRHKGSCEMNPKNINK